MNNVMNTILGGFMVGWTLMLIAVVPIIVVVVARLRRESVSERRRRQVNTERSREIDRLRLAAARHDLCA